MKVSIHSLAEHEKFCQTLKERLGGKALLLLRGPLSAGKTKTVECLVRALGGVGVSSPTFTLHQRYETPKFSVDHFDLYRVESAEDLESTGFWDFFIKEKGWIIVEWAEKLGDAGWPSNWPTFILDIKKDESKGENYRELNLIRVTDS